MAQSILYVSVEKILGKLASLPIRELSLAWNLDSDLQRLRTTLSSIGAVLSDAEEQRFTSNKISLWLRHLRDALYDADDVLDDFAYEALHKHVVNSRCGVNRKVRRFFSSSNSVVYRLRIGHRIKNIRKRFNEIKANKDEFNLNDRADDDARSRIREREMSSSLVNASEVIGRGRDLESIVEFLTNSRRDDDNVLVIPIVGIGGLGKTVLAKMVFNDRRVFGHFDSKVWVCLGDTKEFTVNHAIAKISKALCEQTSFDHVSNSQELKNVIRDNFQGKRFLLILDDVWDANRSEWLELKGILANSAEGSKILVTTRFHSVAKCVGGGVVHNLEGLPHEECVSLFKKFAFALEVEVDESLMVFGDEIVKKCKGVPLAVRSLANHLFSKADEREWESMRDSGIWKMNDGQNDILAILKFSYDHLPWNMKQCFLFCSVFPEDYEFKDYTLISYWMDGTWTPQITEQ